MFNADSQGYNCVRANNNALIKSGAKISTLVKGGNVEAYSKATGMDQTSFCAEFTMCKWEGTAGEDFIALQLILDWAGRIVAKGPRYSPLLNPKMTMIAISQKPHPKEVNLI